MPNEHLAISYALLILHDAGSDLTTSRLESVLQAAKIDIAPVYLKLYLSFIRKNGIEEMLNTSKKTAFGSGASTENQKNEKKTSDNNPKKEIKEVSPAQEEEEDEDMGLGLFG